MPSLPEVNNWLCWRMSCKRTASPSPFAARLCVRTAGTVRSGSGRRHACAKTHARLRAHASSSAYGSARARLSISFRNSSRKHSTARLASGSMATSCESLVVSACFCVAIFFSDSEFSFFVGGANNSSK